MPDVIFNSKYKVLYFGKPSSVKRVMNTISSANSHSPNFNTLCPFSNWRRHQHGRSQWNRIEPGPGIPRCKLRRSAGTDARNCRHDM